MRILFAATCYFLFPLAALAGGIAYNVDFEGLDDSKALKSLKLASHLSSLKKHPPASINALKYRADSDIPEMQKVLRAHGYYEAKVSIQIQEVRNQVNVIVMIEPGVRYKLETYDIHLYCETREEPNACCQVSLDDAGIELNRPAVTQSILGAELNVLHKLSECGYPLAKVEDRQIVVDGKTKTVRVDLFVKTGQKAEFGPTTIVGTKRVKPLFLEENKEWHEGEPYDSRLVDKTQDALIDSGLFSSVLITHEEALTANGEIPMKIEVHETKHKSVNVGVSYQTVFGPGVTFGWANKNVGGMGRTLSLQGDITRISQTGNATYVHPNFGRIGQDMVAQAQAAHESLRFAYSSRSYSLMDRFEREVNRRLRVSIGVMGERLYITDSSANGNYWLVEVPIYLRWSSANSLLNPTRGATFEYVAMPSFNAAQGSEIYLTQEFIGSLYQPLDRKERIVIAEKLTYGFIVSNGLSSVPLSYRFLGGSEQDLRGYRYKTVSPFVDGKAIGGRAAVFGTLEARFRVTNTIGLVPFFDIGSVWTTQYPTLHGKWYKSVGLGLRFFTAMGPFRFDIAFPLDRRKEVDPPFKVLVSIGQMF